MNNVKTFGLACFLLCWIFFAAGSARAQDAPDSKEGLNGFWYDSESKGFYEFRENGTFLYESKDGKKHEGTFESSGTDQEGGNMYRATYSDSETGEERSLFIKVNRDGRSGYTQYKCMKYPFYRSIES